MKYLMTLAVVAALASACTVRTERTVVEKPVPTAPATAVVYTEPAPATTVYVPTR
jgi:hypothetical protein